MAKNSRKKGKDGELELARQLRELGVAARRGRQFKGTADSPDLVTGLERAHVECKRVEQLSIYKALDQADDERDPADMPVVMHRRNHKRWVAVLYLEDFVELMHDAGRVTTKPACNCGVSAGLRSDHEAECARAYRRA